jgi:hypothetical protein
MDKQRRGWIVEFASAVTSDFPDENAATVSQSKYGAWVTASYRDKEPEGSASHLCYVMVGRYIRDRSTGQPSDTADLGGRLIWIADPKAVAPLSLSLEYLRRMSSDVDDTEKVAAVLEYKTPIDNVAIVASYGKDFKNELTGKEPLVSALGINLGFGRGQLIKAPQ